MTALTRRAVRVCTALIELKGKGGDVLDALIPFFEPLLELWHGKIFDPRVFAVGVQKLYRWRFTSDIAEQFIPRLERLGFLERKLTGKEAAFIVQYVGQKNDDQPELSGVLNRIIDEFEVFPPGVTDLLTYSKTREELTDILIRFLVSLDAYAPAAFAEEIRKLNLATMYLTTELLCPIRLMDRSARKLGRPNFIATLWSQLDLPLLTSMRRPNMCGTLILMRPTAKAIQQTNTSL